MKQVNEILIVIFLVAIITSFGFNKSISQVTDIDGNVYKTVIIGNQEWMAENLNVEHYRNGDVIPQVKENEEWSKLTTGAWVYYENKTANGTIFGKIYNWYAVNDPRGLAPEGWHIPSEAEWIILIDYLGGESNAGGKIKATKIWKSPNAGATNESEFAALPGGFRFWHGKFDILGSFGFYWSTTEDGKGNVLSMNLIYSKSIANRSFGGKGYGMSVRCLKD